MRRTAQTAVADGESHRKHLSRPLHRMGCSGAPRAHAAGAHAYRAGSWRLSGGSGPPDHVLPGLSAISPDIMSLMTAFRIASRKASLSPRPQSPSISGLERKAATIFGEPSESGLSWGDCG